VSVAGIVLAAGSGSRMGVPKGLLRLADGTPFVVRAASVLAGGGCEPVLVVVGARRDDVSSLVGDVAGIVVARNWREGMAASLRAGLRAVQGCAPDVDAPVDAVVVGLVDTPGVSVEAVTRLVTRGAPSALARCSYHGAPGHPVLIGRDHWAGVLATARGDAGARLYLSGRDVELVESGDVADGQDVDTHEHLVPWSGERP
jgi:CTP:molybdopterin cytidylyltransferase MocA